MAKLYYFNGRGRGELIRLTLAAAGIQFTEEFISEREQFLKLIEDGKLLFKQLPLLEIDGRQLVQSYSIVRYIGRKAGLCGKTEDETVLIDQYFEGSRDFIFPILRMGFLPEEEVLSSARTQTLPRYLPIYEKILAASGTGFLVGTSMSIADISLLEAILLYVEYLGKEILNDYPAFQKFFTTMTSQQRISSFLSGPQRKAKNDEKYVNTVKRTLAWT